MSFWPCKCFYPGVRKHGIGQYLEAAGLEEMPESDNDGRQCIGDPKPEAGGKTSPQKPHQAEIDCQRCHHAEAGPKPEREGCFSQKRF